MRSKQSKAKNFTQETIRKILRRDKGCIFCKTGRWKTNDDMGRVIYDIAHIVNKSQGGLGIEENGVTACRNHHMQLDNGNKGWRNEMQDYIEEYMRQQYEGWSRDKLVYQKGEAGC